MFGVSNSPDPLSTISLTNHMQGGVQIDLFLRDGVKICQLMNKIKEGAIKKDSIMAGTTEAKKNNIHLFLEAATAYGVPTKYLFEVKREIQSEVC